MARFTGWKQTGKVVKGMRGEAKARCVHCGRTLPLDDLISYEPDNFYPLREGVEFRCRNSRQCYKVQHPEPAK